MFIRSYLRGYGSVLLALLLATVGSAAAAAPERAEQLVRDTFDRSMAALQTHQDAIRDDPRVAYELIEETLAPHVDFERMSRLILARHWVEATPQQQQRFTEEFRELLLRTYSMVLADNVDEAVRQVEAERQILHMAGVEGPDRRGRINVRTVLQFDNQSVPMDYRMYPDNGQWKVFDVLIENISFVMNYRSEYDAQLERGGLDQLIAHIQERNRRAWVEPELAELDP